jgi:hypothetical protein
MASSTFGEWSRYMPSSANSARFQPRMPTDSMPSDAEFDEAKARAEKTIRDSWRDIARSYTLGWGGPIESIEHQFPFVRKAILSIRHQISNDLPVLLFQSRESPPKDMMAAVPFWRDTGNPYNCRLVAIKSLSANETKFYGDFAQAFWFAIKQRMLPSPLDAEKFQKKILSWTGRELFEI